MAADLHSKQIGIFLYIVRFALVQLRFCVVFVYGFLLGFSMFGNARFVASLRRRESFN